VRVAQKNLADIKEKKSHEMKKACTLQDFGNDVMHICLLNEEDKQYSI
jgi:hypothetical protein